MEASTAFVSVLFTSFLLLLRSRESGEISLYDYFSRLSFVGGFLSDSAGYVADQCLTCPRGAYVKLDIYPGTRYKHCRACPRG